MNPTSPKPPPPIERLNELLDYDPESGVFSWRVDRGTRANCGGAMFRRKAGSVAGCRAVSGYIVIRIDKSLYLAHRLAWFLTHGEWPDEIDHIDRNRSNNSISNLRAANRSINCSNMSYRLAKSGHRGVKKKGNRWQAYINRKGKRTHLGSFLTVDAASAAYAEARAKIGH